MNAFYRTPNKTGYRAQAMTEFAIVLPILMALLVGILEVGRMVFIYAAVNNASREAARYASAVGLADPTHYKYNYCTKIEEVARRSAFNFIQPTITISYDNGPGTASFNTCVDDGSGADGGVNVSSGDRVTVTATATYGPLINLIPIGSRTFTSTSSRTIVGVFELQP